MEESENEFPKQQERYAKLGFKPQREIIFNNLLPYADELDNESSKIFANIKGNLGRAMMLCEYRPGFGIWIARLNKYIRVYGLKFSKEDHIALIQFLFEALIIPDLEPSRIHKIGSTLILLLKKPELISPKELELPWRPLRELFSRITKSNATSIGMYRYFATLDSTITNLIEVCRVYFPISATQEILDEWRPRLCPFSPPDTSNALEALQLFLPVVVWPEFADQTYKLWYPEMMDLWQTCHNAPPWENHIMWKIAKLASNNVGYIDWEPYIPIMYTRFLRSLDLPVTYKGHQNGKCSKLDATPMSIWIVATLGNGSSGIKYLNKFMQTIESYYHHANQGRWGMKLKTLLKKISQCFVERLNKERYAKKHWKYPIPDSHKLTEDDITEFIEVLKPVIALSIYGFNHEIMSVLQSLGLVRPAIIIPLVLDKLYSTLDSLTEPHKLTASMQCLVSLARPLVEGTKNGFPEGPTHVIPLLMATLPGIDPNDIRKCLVTFQFISTFVSLIPVVDSSNACDHHSNLTEEEHAVCEATAQFEDFVLQFMDRAFCLIESSSLEVTRLEQVDSDKKSKLESIAEGALSSICTTLLMQMSPSIFKSALRKMDSFVTSRVLETKVSGALVACMVRSFAKVRPDDVVRLFVPRLCDSILLSLKDVDLRKEERLDNELLFNLLILSEVILCKGDALLPYEKILTEVLDHTLWLACKEGALSAHLLLARMVISLSTITPLEYRSLPISYETPVKDFLPVREWGKPGNIYDLKIEWYVPGNEELLFIKRLLWRYLPVELRRLELHACSKATVIPESMILNPELMFEAESGTTELQREELRRSLGVILALLNCKRVLPHWDEEPLMLNKTSIDLSPMELTVGCPGIINMPDGRNVRQVIIEVMEKLQEKILSSAEGDTKSLYHLINIWSTLLTDKGNGRGFETHWKTYHNVKRMTEDKLRGRKRHLRCLLIDRIMLQHELRIEASVHELTPTHAKVIQCLFRLASSFYSEVRSQAQNKLLCALGYFSYSYMLLIPEVKRILELDSNAHHEQFKAALYMLLGPKTAPLIARHDWSLVNEIWPALIRSNLSEKPSVIMLLDSLVDIVHRNFPTITINLKIPNSCIELSKTMWDNHPVPQQAQATEQEIAIGKERLNKISQQNMVIYNDTIKQILDAIEEGNLHWRYHNMALSFLRNLVHSDVPYNARVVRCFLHTLVHDSLDLRKMVLRSVVYVLKQQKRPHKKIDVDPRTITTDFPGGDQLTADNRPGDRKDNLWLQYNSKTRPMSAEEWNKPRYLHKTYNGYYCWPETIKLYAPSSEQPCLDRNVDELTEEEREVHKFFSNEDNVSKLIGYFSLEEKKGKDKFNGFRFVMFKNLFRNHGDIFVPVFLPHIQRLIIEQDEQKQRCAAEIIAALIRATKHWPFEKVNKLWESLSPIINTALANVTVETMQDWGVCLATSCEGRDPNRNHWLYEILMENPIRDEEAAFIECSRLYALQGALNQQEWRVSELLHRLRDYFQNYLTHPFQNVRDRLSSVLTNITEADVLFPGSNRTISPRIEEIIDSVEPKLTVLYKSGLKDFKHVSNAEVEMSGMLEKVCLSDSEKDCALRLMKTIFRWVVSVLSRVHFASIVPFYKLFGLACFLQSYEHDEEVAKICTHFLTMLSQALHPVKEISVALQQIKAIIEPSPSWSARVSAARFLQSFVFHNMSLVISQPEQVEEVNRMVQVLLHDEALDVRKAGGQLLSGLLHCHFIPSSEELLLQFKSKVKTRVHRKSRMLTNPEKYSEVVRQKHAAILGLCAFIDAHPYDVPNHVTDIFAELGAHLNDPEPIPSTIRKTLGDFKRTHHDNWETHKLQFTEEELAVLNDLSVPPSYYA